MTNPSPEKLKAAVQALYQVRAVEGPPGDNGHRSVWHMCSEGAELLSLVDMEGRVQRQELTLLEDHYAWTSGEGLRTGRVEQEGGSKANPASPIIHTDPQLVPHRLMRAARALESYEGDDRYLLHMKRVLSLAREGLELQESPLITDLSQRQAEPVRPALFPQKKEAARGARRDVPAPSMSRGPVVLVVYVMAVVAAIALLAWLF
jgi:hypothetical protein